MEEIVEKIEMLVGQDIDSFPSHIYDWVKEHLVVPKKVQLFEDYESENKVGLWLVTDHTGNNDSSYRVVFDETESDFGLAVTLENGRECFMGLNGKFGHTVEGM